MKTISPVTSWVNGQVTEAKVLNAYVINDNLVSSATFYYLLLSENFPIFHNQEAFEDHQRTNIQHLHLFGRQQNGLP